MIMNRLGVKEIEQILPHRHPFLLVDYIEDYEPGKFAVGYKCVTFREDFFKGHFPQEPVMPGVLMVEALAQTGAVAILSLEENKGKIAYFGGIKNCRFRGKVVPGDKLRGRVLKRHHRPPAAPQPALRRGRGIGHGKLPWKGGIRHLHPLEADP